MGHGSDTSTLVVSNSSQYPVTKLRNTSAMK